MDQFKSWVVIKKIQKKKTVSNVNRKYDIKMEDPELLKKKKKLKIIEKKNKINNNNNNNENNQYDILQEDFYERKTEQWDQLIDIVFSSIFDPVNYKWY